MTIASKIPFLTRTRSDRCGFPRGGPLRLAALAVLTGLSLLAASPLAAQSDRREKVLQLLQERHTRLHADFSREMNELADICAAESYLRDADEIRLRAQPVSAAAFDVDTLPGERLPDLPAKLPDAEARWKPRLRKLEKDYAMELYLLSRAAVKQGFPSLAFQLVREAAFHDPDHRNARKLLGYVLDGNTWTTPFARTMKNRGYVDDPVYGWLRKQDVDRYHMGERFYRGRWISQEREEAERSDFRNAWEIETEHFLVRTNSSLEQGVVIARALETFHRFFLREFTAFFNTPQQMQRLFDEGSTNSRDPSRKHTVVYFRSKDEFVAELKSRQSGIEVANGLYLPNERTAYFYYDEDENALQTIFHEVTHQLLGESLTRKVDVGEGSDFWVIEGIACYMESFQVDSQPASVGDPGHIRIYWARRKALEDGFYVPMRQFTAMSQREFQFPRDIDLLHPFYSQAAGLCHFFLHFEDGLYRDAFVEYLSQVYSPYDRIRTNVKNLEQLTGVRFETLDDQYLDYLKSLPDGNHSSR